MNSLEKFVKIRNINESSRKTYTFIVHNYERYNDLSLDELIKEAETEEIQQIPLKYRKIKTRLLNYQIYLQTNYTNNTVQTYMTKIKTIYKTFEIQIPYLPPANTKKQISTQYNEMITKEEIQQILNSTNKSKAKAIILFIASSGSGRAEATNLTIQDYINATSEYHNSTNITNVIKELETQTVIPTFHMIRQKTQKPYYTFCTPEANNAILTHLKEYIFKFNPTNDQPLFGYKKWGISRLFERLNDKVGLPRKKNGVRKFHPHALRKYFSTVLLNEGMDKIDIDFLSGRTPDTLTDAYYQVAPERRKIKYQRYIKALTINDKINYVDITSKEKQEFEQMKQELEKQKRDNQKIRQMIMDLDKIV